MKKWILPLGSLTAVAMAVIAGLAIAGVFDGDGASGDRTESTNDALGICIEGAQDCVDTIDGGDGESDDGAAACLVGDSQCKDVPDVSQICAEGAEDCVDTIDEPAPPPPDGGDVDPDEPVSSDPGAGGSGNDCGTTPEACEARAIESAYAALEEMGGPPASELEVTRAEYVEWPDSCLGVQQADLACAEVITPGFTVVLDT